MKIIFLNLICICSFRLVLGLLNSPGAQIRISEVGLNQAVQSLIQVAQVKASKIKIPDIPEQKVSKTWGLWVLIRHQVAEKLEIDAASTKVELLPDNTIHVHVGHIALWVRGQCRIHISKWPPWTKNMRMKTYITLNFMDIFLKVSNKNGRPQIDVVRSNAELGRLSIEFYGGIIEQIANLIQSFVHGEIRKTVQKQVNDNLYLCGTAFTNALAKIPMETEMHGQTKDFHINYQLTSDPFVSQKDYAIPIVSQFWYKGHRDDNPPTIKPSGKYPDYSSPKAVCIDVDSNLMFASAAYAFNVSDRSKMVIADDVFGKLKPSLRNAFSCDCQGVLCFTTFFPELKKECKSGGKVKIEVVAQMQAGIHFNNTGAYILSFGKGAFIAEASDGENSLSAKSAFIGEIPIPTVIKFWTEVMREVATIVANDIAGSGIPLPPVDFAKFSNAHLAFNTSNPVCYRCSSGFLQTFPNKTIEEA